MNFFVKRKIIYKFLTDTMKKIRVIRDYFLNCSFKKYIEILIIWTVYTYYRFKELLLFYKRNFKIAGRVQEVMKFSIFPALWAVVRN